MFSDRRSRVIAVCFFLTGFSGLVFEVAWLKLMGQVFGATTFAAATVLASFMAGLAIGGYGAGKLSRRFQNPLLVYGIVEIGLGVFGLAVPLLIRHLTAPLFQWIWTAFHPSFWAFAALRFLAAGLVLTLPATLMGASLPVLAVHFVRSRGELANRIGALYSSNTFGAVAGCLAAGFYLLPEFGILVSNSGAALIDMTVGIVVCLTARSLKPPESFVETSAEMRIEMRAETAEIPVSVAAPADSEAPSVPLAAVLACFFVSGAAAMILEVSWVRALTLVIGPSVYSFTIMLAAFLVGLSSGSWVIARYVDRVSDKAKLLGTVYLLSAGGVWLSVVLYPECFAWYVALNSYFPDNIRLIWAMSFGLVFLVMLVPTLLMGAVFPLVVSLAVPSLRSLGRNVGDAYGINTLGCILGSVAGGFLLVPVLGIRASMLLAVVLQCAVAAVMWWLAPSCREQRARYLAAAAGGGLVFLLVAPAWSHGLMQSGVSIYPARYLTRTGTFDSGEFDRAIRAQDEHLAFFREGLTATVSILQTPPGPEGSGRASTSLRVNGKTDASNSRDMATQIFGGLLPVVFNPEAKTALVIGCGSCVTLGVLLEFSNLEKITLVEIEEGVIDAASWFGPENFEVIHNPKYKDRLKIVIEDGRTFLRSDPAKYDIIFSEPSNPWFAGTANLFTEDFFREVSGRLNPGGVVLQWIQLYSLFNRDLRGVYRSVSASLPEGYVFNFSGDSIVLAMREKRPFPPHERFRALWSDPEHAAYLVRYGYPDAYWLYAQLVGDFPSLVRRLGDAEPFSDYHNTLEYTAPLAMRDQSAIYDNWAWLHRDFGGIDAWLPPETLTEGSYADRQANLAAYAQTSPIRRNYYLKKALDVPEPAVEALKMACGLSLTKNAVVPVNATTRCGELFSRAPDLPEARLLYGRWTARTDCGKAREILEPVFSDPNYGAQARSEAERCGARRQKR